MAAVRPAGPEPTMMTFRVLVIDVRSRSLVGRVTLAEEQRSHEAEDSTDDQVAEVHRPTLRQTQRQQHLQGAGGADEQQGEGDEPEDAGEQPEHDPARDVHGRLGGPLADLADDALDGVGELGRPAGVREGVPGHGRRAYSRAPNALQGRGSGARTTSTQEAASRATASVPSTKTWTSTVGVTPAYRAGAT